MKFDIEHLKRLAERLDYKPDSQQHKDNLVEYCNSDRMMAIAEAFRALEQRAEAAEAKAKNLNDGWLNAIAERDEARLEQGKLEASRIVKESWKERAWTAEEKLELVREQRDSELNRNTELEAKLAELEKQERKPSYFLNRIESSDKWGPEVELRIYESQLDASKSKDDHGGGIIELFTRPAPAVSLAGMLPPEGFLESNSDESILTWKRGWNDCRAAILRNIEEAK